jgi:hypothetical protein
MRNFKTLLIILTLGLFLTSCQKDSDPPENTNDKLFGTWNFIGMTASLKSSITAGTGADEEKIITSYPIIAQNPKGTVTIDSKNFKTSGLSYSFETNVKTQFYKGGILVDSDDSPFEGDIPASSASTTYKTVGTDSIHLESGLIAFDPAAGGGGAPNQTISQDFKISWENDVLILSSPIKYNTVQMINGHNAQVIIDATQVVRLKK